MVDASNVRTVTCENCGREHEDINSSDTVEICDQCCPHEETRSELTGEYCVRCDTKVN